MAGDDLEMQAWGIIRAVIPFPGRGAEEREEDAVKCSPLPVETVGRDTLWCAAKDQE